MRRIITILSILIFAFTLPAVLFANEKIADSLHSILINVEKDTGLWIRCEQIHSSLDLIDFYRNRQFIPVWIDENGPTPLGESFVRTLESTETHGLHPDDYHYACIRAWMDSFHIFSQNKIPINSKESANLDIVMTDAFMIFASHLVEGKVDPEHLYPQWISGKRKANVFAVLHNLLEHRSLERAIKALAPPHRDYWRMVNAVTHLKSVVDAGGWPLVPRGKRLKRGEKDQRIYLLRQRLEMSGDLIWQQTADKSRFDKNLETAVKKFQARHGLKADGIVGPQTQTALNISARDRRRQLLLNLERWRWLTHNWGDRYILVNTASFNLEAYQGEEQQLDMRVVVGKTYTKTPVFSKQMRYLTINPYWNVPRSIVFDELLPKIKQDAVYLEKNHYELISGWKEPAIVTDPHTIEWETINDKNFPGRLRQQPGPWNPMGRIKFMFPNRFNVYLHDTS
ncbi:MAG: L,D-transpeptidase family protein, partial [Deltaproteobacteria bacterium]|nr:L,D-transpeptidase family protein [Deltaproteobacteria bacterium]